MADKDLEEETFETLAARGITACGENPGGANVGGGSGGGGRGFWGAVRAVAGKAYSFLGGKTSDSDLGSGGGGTRG